MTAPKKEPKPPAPKPPYEKTYLPGPETIIKIIEDLRTLNTDGYAPASPGFLAKVKNFGMKQTKGTVCSPFTGNVIGCAFDPDYDKKNVATDEFQPMFNGGADALPFGAFYKMHNNDDQPAQSVEKYNLGKIVDKTEIRRGDVIGIDWSGGGGHAVFVWDVHIDPTTKKVDAFLFVGANGKLVGTIVHDHNEEGLKAAQAVKLGGDGVTISGCNTQTKDATDRWLKGKAATYSTSVTEQQIKKKNKKKKPDDPDEITIQTYKIVGAKRETEGTLEKAKSKIFDDTDEDISKRGQWYAIPGVSQAALEKGDKPFALGRKIVYGAIGTMHCATFWYSKDPPPPPEHKPIAPTPPAPTPKNAGHTEAPAQIVKGDTLKIDSKAKEKVVPKPAKQEKDKQLFWQHYVERALQVFYMAKWIDKDPGKGEDINDPQTQAALKAYQTLFELDVDGKVGPQTITSMLIELPVCIGQVVAQHFLGRLFDGKKISTDPGPPDGTNHDKTKAAIEEFQKKNGLKPTKVPDSATHKKIIEVAKSHAPTPDAPGLTPQVTHLYWVGNTIDPGGNGKLRLHSIDLKSSEPCTIHLHDEVSKTDVDATVTLNVDSVEAEANVPIPFPAGASVQAKVVTQSAGEISTVAPLHVGRGLEQADWREFIDKDAVPDDVIEKIKRNRARWPTKKISLVTKGKYAGPKHYNYGPPDSHGKWAREYIKTEKVDKATGFADKHIAQVFVEMMKSEKGSEGQPASFQTYDNQIVTWGVGFGGMGDGVNIFLQLNSDAKMQRLLDDLGLQYLGNKNDGRYHVVHVGDKKVVSSTEVTKVVKKKGKPDKEVHVRWDHKAPLDAWRDQLDAMSAIISISEDEAYRTQIIEAQWRVYVANSSTWTGQDKIFSLSLYYLITHSQHWLPALAINGFRVNDEWTAIKGDTPSIENDKKLAQRLLNGFLGAGKKMHEAGKLGYWKEVHKRVNDDLWTRFKTDASKEGFDAGEFVYTVDE